MALWLDERPLVLASQSEIRRALLCNAGIPIEVQPADIDERAVVEASAKGGGAGEIALLLAAEKAKTVAAGQPGRLVLGADQTLALEQRRFSKPADRSAARAQLEALRGSTHELHSAVVLVQSGAVLWQYLESARLTMRGFTDAFLADYLDLVGPAVMRSVGGYQLEGAGVQLFEHIEGDHFVILGLPLLALLQFLRRQGRLAR